jgi:hypothetical protein
MFRFFLILTYTNVVCLSFKDVIIIYEENEKMHDRSFTIGFLKWVKSEISGLHHL